MQKLTSLNRRVREESRHLGSLAKWALRAFFLLGLMVVLASQAAAAPVVFTASAEFEGLRTPLSGTITIDTATGKVLSVDLKVGTKYSFTRLPWISHRPLTVTQMEFVDGQSTLELVLPVSTLVGYQGGEIGPQTWFDPSWSSGPFFLISGTLKEE